MIPLECKMIVYITEVLLMPASCYYKGTRSLSYINRLILEL